MPNVLSPAQIEAFGRDRFVAPVRAISERRARHYRNQLEAFEAASPDARRCVVLNGRCVLQGMTSRKPRRVD